VFRRLDAPREIKEPADQSLAPNQFPRFATSALHRGTSYSIDKRLLAIYRSSRHSSLESPVSLLALYAAMIFSFVPDTRHGKMIREILRRGTRREGLRSVLSFLRANPMTVDRFLITFSHQ
jgi:hypothetical protein